MYTDTWFIKRTCSWMNATLVQPGSPRFPCPGGGGGEGTEKKPTSSRPVNVKPEELLHLLLSVTKTKSVTNKRTNSVNCMCSHAALIIDTDNWNYQPQAIVTRLGYQNNCYLMKNVNLFTTRNFMLCTAGNIRTSKISVNNALNSQQ